MVLQPGDPCTVVFTRVLKLCTIMSIEKKIISFPARIPFRGCTFQEAYIDPYAGRIVMYAIQVPVQDETWIVHVTKDDVDFLCDW